MAAVVAGKDEVLVAVAGVVEEAWAVLDVGVCGDPVWVCRLSRRLLDGLPPRDNLVY